MRTYAVTPTLFVGVVPPDGVEPVVDLTHVPDVETIITRAVWAILSDKWATQSRPAVLVASQPIAYEVLRAIGLTPEQAQERCDFATRSVRGADGRS